MQNAPHRETFIAHLRSRKLLSESSQTWHLEFATDAALSFIPGQFISILSERTYPAGHARAGQSRIDTRAYSIASAPAEEGFALCLNRLDTADGRGHFSNLLCNLSVGDPINFHGPHGTFGLNATSGPILLLAEETGIAPIRSILHSNQDLAATLIQASITSETPLYVEELRGMSPLKYIPIHDDLAYSQSLTAAKAALIAAPEIHEAYIVGLSPFVNAHRIHLKELGWDRKQIIFERYD
jgi:ferredoxin-NADP reductase